MALTLAYDNTVSRVRINVDTLGAATTVTISRSLDQVTWTVVRGGQDLPVTASAAALDDYEFTPSVINYYRAVPSTGATQTGNITPVITDVWLKSLNRPFLNRPVACANLGEITRPARSTTFDVIGRSMPVAVSDVRGSRRFTLQVVTGISAGCGDTDGQDSDATTLDLLMASGDPVLLQSPPGSLIPTMYATVGDTSSAPTITGSHKRIFQLPLTEIAAPGADIVGSTATWQTVLSNYATWNDVMTALATWHDVLELVASPTEVIVP